MQGRLGGSGEITDYGLKVLEFFPECLPVALSGVEGGMSADECGGVRAAGAARSLRARGRCAGRRAASGERDRLALVGVLVVPSPGPPSIVRAHTQTPQ